MLRIEFNTDNAAFHADYEDEEKMTDWQKSYVRNEEIRRVLKNICNQLDNGNVSGSCIDINGNKVGTWELD